MGLYLVHTMSRHHPEYNIQYIVDKECASLVLNHPQIQKVHVLSRKEIQEKFQNNQVPEAYATLDMFLRQLDDSAPFHISINLYQEDYGAIINSMVTARKKVGKVLDSNGNFVIKDAWSQYLYAIPANRKANPFHVIDLYHRIADIKKYNLPLCKLPPVDLNNHSEFLRTLEKEIRYFVIQMTSAWPGKCWPRKHWISLVKLFLQNTEDHVVLIGAPQDRNDLESLTYLAPDRIINLAGKTTLLDTSLILKSANFIITGDTFAMHMATVMKCPVFALFGPSNPIETGPYGLRNIIIQSDNEANLDFDFVNQEHPAMSDIEPYQCFNVLMQNDFANITVYETFWNNIQNYQFMVNVKNGQHTLKRQVSLLPDLDELDLGKVLDLMYRISDDLERLIVSQNFPREILTGIDQMEMQLKELTDQNISFELYRIKLNSITAKDFIAYCKERMVLLHAYIQVMTGKVNIQQK